MHFSGYPEPYNGITTPIHYMYISDSLGTVYCSAYTELRKHARSVLGYPGNVDLKLLLLTNPNPNPNPKNCIEII